MNKQIFRMAHNEARRRAIEAVQNAPEGYVVTISEPTRTLDANAAMWPVLEAFSEQLLWPVNGQMVKLTAEEWKDLLTAAFRKESPRLAMGISGGMVMLGIRTSKLGKREFSDFLEFIHSVAADRDVDLSYQAAA